MTATHFRLRLVPGDPIPLAPTEAAAEIARLEQLVAGYQHGNLLLDLCSGQLLKVADRVAVDQPEYADGMRHAINALSALRTPVVSTIGEARDVQP